MSVVSEAEWPVAAVSEMAPSTCRHIAFDCQSAHSSACTERYPHPSMGAKGFQERVGSQAVTKVRTMHNLPHLRVPAAEVLVNASGSLKPRNCKPHQAKSNENDPDLPHRLIAEQWPFTTSGRELHHVWEPATVAEQKHQKHSPRQHDLHSSLLNPSWRT